jgi:tRNA A-37 threonylcarbamoyl transferase component Bud32
MADQVIDWVRQAINEVPPQSLDDPFEEYMQKVRLQREAESRLAYTEKLSPEIIEAFYNDRLDRDASVVREAIVASEEVVKPSLLRRHWKMALLVGGLGVWAAKPLSWFSGKDDNYNTIEGLKHGGLAEYKRRELTHFGSGIVREALGMSMNEFIHTPMSKGNLLKRLVSYVKKSKISLTKNPRIPAQSSLVVGGSLFDPTVSLGINIPPSARSSNSVGFIFGHEVSESIHSLRQHKIRPAMNLGGRVAGLQKLPGQGKRGRWIPGTFVGSHHSMAVIGDELAIAAKLGPETYMAAKNARYQDLDIYADMMLSIIKPAQRAVDLIKTAAASQTGFFAETRTRLANAAAQRAEDFLRSRIALAKRGQQYHYIKKTLDTYTSFEKKWLHKFSGFDDTYNTIEGLKHGGKAEELRKIITEFGSGWDPLRALVKQFTRHGSLNRVISSRSFQEALTSGKVLKTLGQGASGKAELMESTFHLGGFNIFGKQFGGKKIPFQYVRKTALNKGVHEEFALEAEAMKALGAHNAPTFYGAKKGTLFMEAFHGEEIHKIIDRGGSIPIGAIEEHGKFLDIMHKAGFSHNDLMIRFSGVFEPHNMMLTSEGHLGIYDFGMTSKTPYQRGFARSHGTIISATQHHLEEAEARRFTSAEFDNKSLELLQDLRYKQPSPHPDKISTSYEITPTPEQLSETYKHAKLRAIQMAETQKTVAKQMAENARAGGKRSKSSFVTNKVGLKR